MGEIDDLRPLPVCTCNLNKNFLRLQQDQRVMMFLMKLHKDLSEVAEFYHMLLQEESHKDLSKPLTVVEPMAICHR